MKQYISGLIISAFEDNNLGLRRGLMGRTIRLYESLTYFEPSVSVCIQNFAETCLDYVLNNISKKLDITDFDNGICGIGWGIDYLISHGMVGGYSSEVLEEIDYGLLNYNVQNLDINSLRSIIKYTSAHLYTVWTQEFRIIYPNSFLQQLIRIGERCAIWKYNESYEYKYLKRIMHRKYINKYKFNTSVIDL